MYSGSSQMDRLLPIVIGRYGEYVRGGDDFC